MNNNIYCFFGVDGAGKTTTINEVKKRLEQQGYPCVAYLMGRAGNHKLPLIKTFMKFKAKRLKQKKGIDPKKDALLVDIYRKRGLLFMSIYYLDLWLRYGEVKRLAKKNIVLMDRFFYDGLALSKKQYVSFFKKLTPKIKSFFLYAPPEVIRKRKQEATMQNMRDYKKRVEQEFVGEFDIQMIDTSQPLKKVVSTIENEITKHSPCRRKGT